MTETARMYGGSLYDLAAEEGLETRILGELDEAVALFKASPEYLHLLSTPSIPKKERCGLLDEALRGQVHLYVLNFLKILCEKGTLRELPGCARAFRVKYNQAHGILEATATSAIPMTAEQTERLHEKAYLNAYTYYKTGKYKSAIVAFKNALKQYPESKRREEIMYLIVKSGSKLADNSVQDKQADRYLSTLDSYYSFVAEFPESHYLKELDRLAQNAKDFLDRNNKEKQ